MLEKTSVTIYCPDKYLMSETYHSQCIFIFKDRENWYIYSFLTEIVSIKQLLVRSRYVQKSLKINVY